MAMVSAIMPMRMMMMMASLTLLMLFHWTY
jgi:hypothetical protein